ncbi:MAG: FecR domain-containing protein [Planctomycetota bacterium]
MEPTSRTKQLVQRHLDGGLQPAELAELQKVLRNHPAAADYFAHAARLDAALAEHFCEARRVRELSQWLASSAGQELQAGTAPRKRWRMWWGLSTVAAALLLAAGVLTGMNWLGWGNGRGPGAAPIAATRVISGAVFVDGAEQAHVPAGARLRVGQDAPAALLLAEGSRVNLRPGSEAIVHGPEGPLREVFELLTGAGDFDVERAEGRFEVRTSVGTITVLGTKFTAELVPAKPDADPETGPSSPAVLLVKVTEGVVSVRVGRFTHRLTAGQNGEFREDMVVDEERAAGIGRRNELAPISPAISMESMAGTIVELAPSQLVLRSQMKHGSARVALALDAGTEVLLESPYDGQSGDNREQEQIGSLGNLALSQQVRVIVAKGRATRVVILPPAQPAESRHP